MSATGATEGDSADRHQAELNCTKCLATFDSSEAKRSHMRGDWQSVLYTSNMTSRTTDKHSVYNLKRHIASLPPIPLTVFQTQVLASDSGSDEKEKLSSFQRSCTACEHHYTNRKAWQAHLKSRNHAQKTAEKDPKYSSLSDESPLSTSSLHTDEEMQSTDEEADEESFSPTQCLFCIVESATMDSNLTHMLHAHSFFIPNTEFLIDMESLLSYLFAVVSVFHECLSCGSSKTTKFGVQDHMRRKGHCKVDFEDDEHDLNQFYDFSGDVDDEGDQPKTKVTLDPNEDEFRLPSGKTVGHRSRARFYRQHLTEHPSSSTSPRQQLLTDTEAEIEAEAESEHVPIQSTDRRLAMRAGTSSSLIGVPELQRRALIAIEKKMEKMEIRAKNEYQHVLEKGGNKQKRYKVASLGKKQGGLEKRLG